MKQYVIAMAAACTLFLASCGNSPEKVVTDFYTANKANDFEKAMEIVHHYAACFQNCQSLILGCTHYPLVKEFFRRELPNM